MKIRMLSILAVLLLIAAAAPAQNPTPTSGASYLQFSTATWTAQTATGVTPALDTNSVMDNHTIQLTTTGAPATCTYDTEASLDGAFWTKIITGTTCTTSISASVADKPYRYIRGNLTALTGGTAPTVQLRYAGAQ